MNLIESTKTYTGRNMETIFFRPMLSGESAEELGIRVLYNIPTPTTVQLWTSQGDVLQPYTQAGWTGGNPAIKGQKTIHMTRVKAELGFSASDYFAQVYELIACRADVNMDDLTGSELEQAETEIFRKAIAESLRTTMWIGDPDSGNPHCCFKGFLKSCMELSEQDYCCNFSIDGADLSKDDFGIKTLRELWVNADERLRQLKHEGQLAFFVTSDIYESYENYLNSLGVESSYSGLTNGHPGLCYRGIPVIDLHLTTHLFDSELPNTMGLLTDRRNLVLAVNTSDFPGTEVRMWYNPDEMENRQRALFMAGCEILDEELVSFCKHPIN